MKKTAIALMLVSTVGLTGCFSTGSSGKNGLISADNNTAVKEQRLTTEFVDEGIKIHYTFFGNVEKIEVFGQAPVWKGNHDIIAEADARVKLVKFLHGENVTNDRRIKIIGRAIENARDNGVTTSTSRDLEASGPSADVTAHRQASRVDNTLVTTLTTITSQGRLIGVRKVKDYTVDGGKTYVAVYEWSEKQQGTADEIRKRMSRSF